jgi:hypothetical protein
MGTESKTDIGAVYTHSKGAKYLVMGVGKNSNNRDDHQPEVAYISLDPGERQGQWCFRDEVEFHEPVEWPDGKTRPRFCLNPK